MLQVCEHLERLRDYNALFAAVAGLHTASVNRLKHTWAAVGPDTHERGALDHLLELTQPAKNYLNYRNQLQQDTDARLPCIPYFGLYLHDLIFVEDGNESTLPGPSDDVKLINFEKFRMMAAVLEAIASYQALATRYALSPVRTIQEHLVDDGNVCDDNTLYRLSLEHEPRNAKPPSEKSARRKSSSSRLLGRLRSRRNTADESSVTVRMQPVKKREKT